MNTNYMRRLAGGIVTTLTLLASTTMNAQDMTLFVGGTMVTPSNAANLKGSWLKSGKVSYDYESNTLTLDNAVISNENNDGEQTGIKIYDGADLIIKVIGTNEISSTNTTAIANVGMSRFTITGGGSLSLRGNNDPTKGRCGILSGEDGALTIDDCTIYAEAANGIAGGTMVFKNANITAKGVEKFAAIWAYRSLTLNGCRIDYPANAYDGVFADDLQVRYKGIVVDETVGQTKVPTPVWQEVRIVKDATSVGQITENNAVVDAVYDLQGNRLSAPASGFNVLRMSDGSTRKVVVP